MFANFDSALCCIARSQNLRINTRVNSRISPRNRNSIQKIFLDNYQEPIGGLIYEENKTEVENLVRLLFKFLNCALSITVVKQLSCGFLREDWRLGSHSFPAISPFLYLVDKLFYSNPSLHYESAVYSTLYKVQ
jgi:hypothetical protein